MLKELHAHGIGPQSEYHLELAPRLNLFTGDNGLGKTFILDLIWYGCTFTWADNPLYPKDSIDTVAWINAQFKELSDGKQNQLQSNFDWVTERWVRKIKPKETINSIAIYAGVKSSYCVWDTIRTPYLDLEGENAPFYSSGRRPETIPPSYSFTEADLWNGREFNGKTVCNGLISDFVMWQYAPRAATTKAFNILESVLEVLSPPFETLKLGSPQRLASNDVRDIPTIAMPYGEIPIVLASSAVKRILELSYAIVWSWLEHLEATKIKKLPMAKNFVLVVDEIENHLHPKWQRVILPALLKVVSCLSPEISIQLFVTTHSPLVLSSIENIVSENDRLFHFDLKDSGVSLSDTPWIKRGEASSWLRSDIFGLSQDRSKEAEEAINVAKDYMLGNISSLPEDLKTKPSIDQRLREVLSPHDRFWMEWDFSI